MNLHRPGLFHFYDAGIVERTSNHPTFTAPGNEFQWVGCPFYGDLQGLVLAATPGDAQDPSLYSELINVLASQWATAESKLHQRDILVRHPRNVSMEFIRKLAAQLKPTVAEEYLLQNHKIPVFIFYHPSLQLTENNDV